MVGQQHFDVGWLGAGSSSSRSVLLFFRLAMIQSCVFCGFSPKKIYIYIKKYFKPVPQVPTSQSIHQRARVCCLSRGGEGPTTGIRASLICPELLSQGIGRSDAKAYPTCEPQVPRRGSVCLLLFREFLGW